MEYDEKSLRRVCEIAAIMQTSKHEEKSLDNSPEDYEESGYALYMMGSDQRTYGVDEDRGMTSMCGRR